MNYQYYAFGTPALALKRSLADESVVAPYATLMASQIRPHAAVANLRRLDALGAFGRFGYYDAIDFTPSRLPEGADHAIVRNVMAHHHGMSIVAIANAVLDGIHRNRFHADPVIEAAELLLQEKAPREVVAVTRPDMAEATSSRAEATDSAVTQSDDPERDRRSVAILAGGRMSAMLGATGGGQLRYDDLALTRRVPDPTLDRGGIHLFLRDTDSGAWWSATTAPRRAPDETAHAVFSDHKAEFFKQVDGIESRMEVIVACEAAAEGRRLTIRNRGTTPRAIEVTSYGEIVLDRDEADLAHPAFSKMFVKTTIRHDGRAITAFRNPRNRDDRVLHLAHLVSGPEDRRPTEAETDRRAFIGRGRTLGTAAAFDRGARLTGADGFTLDPIFSLRRKLRIAPGKEASLVFWTVAADTPEALDGAVMHYRRAELFDHEERLAWTQSQVQLRHYAIPLDEAALFRRYAAALVYPEPRLELQDSALRAALGSQSDLWPLGLSGDRPIMVLRIDSEVDLPIIRKALRMASYFRARRLRADLVILNERASSYVQDLQSAIQSMCDMAARADHVDVAQRVVFPVRRDQMTDATHATLLAAARIVLHTRNGKLSEQLSRILSADTPEPAERPAKTAALVPTPGRAPRFPDETLQFWNGYGGFAEDGRDYVVRLKGRTAHTASVDQRHRPRRFRLSRVVRRLGLHLVGELARLPDHAVVERPGREPAWRSDTDPRSRHRSPRVALRGVVRGPEGAARGSSRHGPVDIPELVGLDHHRGRTGALRRRAGQADPGAADQPGAAAVAAGLHRLRRTGSGAGPRPHRADGPRAPRYPPARHRGPQRLWNRGPWPGHRPRRGSQDRARLRLARGIPRPQRPSRPTPRADRTMGRG